VGRLLLLTARAENTLTVTGSAVRMTCGAALVTA
jgi:hypothetical protein